MKLFLRSFSSLPLNHSRRVVVSYKQKYVHEVLVNCLFKIPHFILKKRLSEVPKYAEVRHVMMTSL